MKQQYVTLAIIAMTVMILTMIIIITTLTGMIMLIISEVSVTFTTPAGQGWSLPPVCPEHSMNLAL